MNRLAKTALMASVAFGVITTAAHAQDAAAPQDPGADVVEDIIVTARRTEESLQSTPLAISAFSGASLEARGAQQVTDLQGAVPNLNVVPGRGSSNATNIYIRGIGQPDALQTFDPAVGVYVDDVYYSRIRGTQFDLLDLERVEVLRGPQGTLYGKNTIGGALKLVSRRPGDTFRARASLAAGNYDMYEAQAAVSGPIDDIAGFSLSVLHSERGGYVTDPVTGAEYNDKNTNAARAALSLRGGDNFWLDLSADYSHDDAGLNVGQPLNTLTNLLGVPLLVLPATAPEYNFQTRTTPGLPNETRLEHWGTSARVTWDLSDTLTFKSITAYRELRTDDYIDIDATELETGDVLVQVDQNQASQEFQLVYDSGPITAVGGLYWLREQVDSHQEAYADDLTSNLVLLPFYNGDYTFTRYIDDELTTTSKAAFANVNFAVTDKLNISGGVRYTDERKDYDRYTYTTSDSPFLLQTRGFYPPTGKWDDTSVMASVDYQFTDDVMAYARYSQGFKSGGFNGRANAVNGSDSTAYEPETADSWEVGIKTQSWDNRLRLNATYFSTKYENFQARVSGVDTLPGDTVPTPVLSVINAGQMDIQGVELEATVVPVSNLTIDAQIGWLDAEYAEFADARFTAFGGSRAFQAPAFSPEWTARIGGQYVFDLASGGDVTIGGAARFRSRMALAVDNTLVNSNVELEGLFQDDYWLYDARVVWNEASGRYSLGLFGQNLSDEVYKTDGQEFSSIGNIRTAYYGAPRTWMVKLTARY